MPPRTTPPRAWERDRRAPAATPAPNESQVKAAIRQALTLEPGLVIWNNPSGVADYHGTRVRYGLIVGASDLIGMLTVDGLANWTGPLARFIALEVKTPRGRLSREQVLFQALVRRMGGFAATVRSVDDARQAIARARAGACE